MTNYFADTNIFVRYYLNDDPRLSQKAQQIIDGCLVGKYTITICSTTFLELAWTLRSFYRQPKDKIVVFIERLLKTKNLTVFDRALAEKTISCYKAANIDITDGYFAALMEQENIKEIFSFDHDFDKIPTLKRLEKV